MLFIIILITFLTIFLYKIFHNKSNADNFDYYTSITKFNTDIEKQKLKKEYEEVFNKKSYDDFLEKIPDIKPKKIIKENHTIKIPEPVIKENLDNDIPEQLDFSHYTPIKPKYKNKYEELLHKPEWYKFREQVVKNRGGYYCEWCNHTKNLQIHHKLYYLTPNDHKLDPWLYDMNEVLLLCDDCHKKYHTKYKVKTYRISNSKVWSRSRNFYKNS